MFRSVFISESLPRDITSFNSSFMEGLGMSRFFGLFFLIGGIALFLLAAFKFKMYFPAIILLAVAVFGYSKFNYANKKAAEREKIFLNGQIVYATVKDHSRQFNMFKSSKDYTITVLPKNSQQNITLVNSREGLWQSAPIGGEILGIEHEGKYFFGQEMSVQFKLFNK